MAVNLCNILPLICLCFAEAYSNNNELSVKPEQFEDTGKPFAEFVCEGNLSQGEWLSWYREQDQFVFTTVKQKSVNFPYKKIKLVLPLELISNGDNIYCAKTDSHYTSYTNIWVASKAIPFVLEKPLQPYGNDILLQIYPKTFVDKEQSFTYFTCWAFLIELQVLSWYQKKESKVSRLAMVQQTNYFGYTKLEMWKTLEPSDNGSVLYCARETVQEDNGEVTFLIEQYSSLVPIMFHRHIESLETAHVKVHQSNTVILYDEGKVLKLVCEGSKPVDGRSYRWYLRGQRGGNIIELYPTRKTGTNITDQYYIDIKMEPSHHRHQLYFAQDYRTTLQVTDTTWRIYTYGELVKSSTITLLHRRTVERGGKPDLTPKNFVDQNNTYMVFTCYSFTQPGEILAWYQSDGLNRSEEILKMIQPDEDLEYKEGQWTVLTLNKTLEPPDNGSEIYCAKQRALPGRKVTEGLRSERVPINLQNDVPPLGLFTVVEPNETVYFDANTTQQFICSGSTPVDGRNFIWFMEDSNSSLPIADGQYDNGSIRNVLELFLDESYNRSQLYCAQGFLADVRHDNGSSWKIFYGEKARSNAVTLMLREEGDIKWTILAIAMPLCLVAIAAVVVVLRRRRTARPATPATPVAPTTLARPKHAPPAPPTAPPPDYDGDGDYVTISKDAVPMQVTYVTYAVLDLPRAGAHATTAEPSLYAEVVGVYG